MPVDDKLLREAGILNDHPQNGPSMGGSRSHSLREGDSGMQKNGLITVCDMPEPQTRRYVVPGLLPDGALSILYGDGGLGKSYLALHLALCAALAHPFAGRPLEKHRTLYLDAELDQDEFVRRAYWAARGLGLEGPPEGLYYCRLPGSLNDPNVRAHALAYKVECGADLVIIDSLTVASY